MTDKFIFNPKNSRSREINDPNKLLPFIEACVSLGTAFELASPKDSQEFIQQIEKLIKELSINVELHPDSDPEAIDYIINFLDGSSLGALQGAYHCTGLYILIAGSLTAAAKAGIIAGVVMPPVVPFVTGGVMAGAVLGGSSGLLAARWRLKVSYNTSLIIYNKDNYIIFNFEAQF